MTDPKDNPEHHITEDLLPVIREIHAKHDAEQCGEATGISQSYTDIHRYARLYVFLERANFVLAGMVVGITLTLLAVSL